MRCRDVQGVANPAKLSDLLFLRLPGIAACCVRVRVKLGSSVHDSYSHRTNLAMNPATHSGTYGGGSRRRSALADPRVVFGSAKPLSSRIMGPWRSSRS